jgi:hypothetical protein
MSRINIPTRERALPERRKPMKLRPIAAATCATLALSIAGAVSADDGEAQTVTKDFEAAIPMSPGKSLIAQGVDYAPGAASVPHPRDVGFHLRLCDLGRIRRIVSTRPTPIADNLRISIPVT